MWPLGNKSNSEAMVHLNLLGYEAVEAVTGFEGTITSLSFDLYGCIQALVTPRAKDSELPNSLWFDVPRLTIGDRLDVPMPDFVEGYVAKGLKGPADKPCK